MIVRSANWEDFERVLTMGEQFYAMTEQAKHVPFCRDTARHYLEMAETMGLFTVLVDDKKPVGFVFGIKAPFVFNQMFQAGMELAWWIDPEYRGTANTNKMLDHVEMQARRAGLTFWNMLCLECSEPDKVEKIYLKRGYVATERAFTKVLK